MDKVIERNIIILNSDKRQINEIFLDIIVSIQPNDAFVSVGDQTEFSCNFTGQHRVKREKITWLKGNIKIRIFLFN